MLPRSVADMWVYNRKNQRFCDIMTFFPTIQNSKASLDKHDNLVTPSSEEIGQILKANN